eukprot:2454723-Prymnesium_polylepis.1
MSVGVLDMVNTPRAHDRRTIARRLAPLARSILGHLNPKIHQCPATPHQVPLPEWPAVATPSMRLLVALLAHAN